ncbi:MAG: hypothetical protein KA767_13030 [Saprospiraceae bacterium]|nr:hypothetical protein [Saprospiraceae bacterium]
MDHQEMLQILSVLAFVILFLSGIIAVISIINYKKFDISLKFLTIYFVVAFIFEAVSLYLARNGINNLFLFHIYAIIEFSLLVVFFSNLIYSQQAKKRIYVFMVTGILFLIADSLFIQGITVFNSYGLFFVSATVLAMSILFFKMLLDKGEFGLSYERHKWIIFGIFITHAVSIIILFFSNAISGFEKSNQYILWILRSVLIIVAKLLIGLAYLRNFGNRKLI